MYENVFFVSNAKIGNEKIDKLVKKKSFTFALLFRLNGHHYFVHL